MSMPRRRASWPILFAAIALPCSAGAAPADGEIAGEGFEVTRYALALAPDMAGGTVAGREIVSLRATREGLKRLIFSGNGLSIDSARLDGAPVAPRRGEKTLAFDLVRPLARGRTVRLELTYHGRPARGLATSATGLYTSYFACDWMICAQDKFGEKAAFSLDLSVPAGMQTLSLGRRSAVRPGPDGREIHRWQAPRPYSAYLYGFAVGRFARAHARVGGAELALLSDVAGETELKRRFAETPAMVRFLSAKAGLPLPVRTYSQLLVEGGEAQEAATYSVLGKDSLPSGDAVPEEDWAIVHELAHQWWGNLVTCETLRDFWLNEGITTFMTAAWKEHRYGRAAYDAELRVARARLDRAGALGFDKPLAWAGRYPSLGARRAVQYGKGALFMAHLREQLGEAAFWSGLRRYTRAHAGGTVTSRDLQAAMEAASGRDLAPLFGEWVYGSNPEQTAAPQSHP